MVGLVVLAVLLATRLGGPPTPRARNVVLGALIVLGVDRPAGHRLHAGGPGRGRPRPRACCWTARSAPRSRCSCTAWPSWPSSPSAATTSWRLPVLRPGRRRSPATRSRPGASPARSGRTARRSPATARRRQPPAYGQPPQQQPQQPYPPQGGYVRAPYGASPATASRRSPTSRRSRELSLRSRGAHPQQPMGQQPPSASQPPPVPPAPASPQPAATPQASQDEGEGEWTRAYGTGETSAARDRRTAGSAVGSAIVERFLPAARVAAERRNPPRRAVTNTAWRKSSSRTSRFVIVSPQVSQVFLAAADHSRPIPLDV